ncbi:MAG: hypothetical protein WBL40_13095 [Terrimicrobiaceae bacterium]
MLAEKQKSEDRDNDRNDLPDVGIQAPHVAQKGKQPNACDHQRSSNALLRKTEWSGQKANHQQLPFA